MSAISHIYGRAVQFGSGNDDYEDDTLPEDHRTCEGFCGAVLPESEMVCAKKYDHGLHRLCDAWFCKDCIPEKEAEDE